MSIRRRRTTHFEKRGVGNTPVIEGYTGSLSESDRGMDGVFSSNNN